MSKLSEAVARLRDVGLSLATREGYTIESHSAFARDLRIVLAAFDAGGVDNAEQAKPADDSQSEEVDRMERSEPPLATPTSVGWKTVPIEPTRAMLDAGYDAGVEWGDTRDNAKHQRRVWTAMLSAAPEPTSLALGGEKEGFGSDLSSVDPLRGSHTTDQGSEP